MRQNAAECVSSGHSWAPMHVIICYPWLSRAARASWGAREGVDGTMAPPLWLGFGSIKAVSRSWARWPARALSWMPAGGCLQSPQVPPKATCLACFWPRGPRLSEVRAILKAFHPTGPQGASRSLKSHLCPLQPDTARRCNSPRSLAQGASQRRLASCCRCGCSSPEPWHVHPSVKRPFRACQ